MATIKTQLNRIKAQVEKFNTELEAYHKVAGDYNLPEIDCTIIGYSEVTPYEIEDHENGFWVKTADFDYNIAVLNDEDTGDEYVRGWDEVWMDSLKDSIAYDRRRLRKAWRVWKSENPDAELERDDDNE